ncbi:hypothetical protein GCM10012289_75540 [Nonomuraea cavernae]|uniref:Uncharacterized protein n=2 Tax=Nonomuraea cavernae TaxID=2045107 RepID=A0A917ZIY8_9ACTN|nr:hypothetical protein GCM10012289_75540 [Nonomuraea cavernae]
MPPQEPPGRVVPPLANPGRTRITATPTPPTNPGFYKKLITALNPLRQTTREAMVLSAVGVGALALDVAATANLGDPALFYFRRERWKELSGLVEATRKDVWVSYFGPVVDHWEGDAVAMLQQYVRFKINNLYTLLSKISDDMSGTMYNQCKEVLTYDLSVFGLYATTAPILRTLMAASAHPVGQLAMRAQIGAFLTVAGIFAKQFADIWSAYEGDLNKLELKLNQLRGSFYEHGNPDYGTRFKDLKLNDDITYPDNWIAK